MAPSIPSMLSFGGVLLFTLQSLADPQQNQKPLVELEDTEPARPLYPAQDAELTLYPETDYGCVLKRGHSTSYADIPMGTCASANFTLDGRVLLGHHGFCEGQKNPTVVVYQGANCSGYQKRLPWRSRGLGPGHCLTKYIWDDSIREEMASLQEWSIMFHCTEDQLVTSETPKMDITEPAPPPPPAEKPEKQRLELGIASDSACHMGAKGVSRLTFQLPLADVCVNVAARRTIKIFQAALCPDGTEAMFANWHQSGCRGQPISVQEVDESLIASDLPDTCVEMGGKRESSYAFVCGGPVQVGPIAESVVVSEDEDGTQHQFIRVNEQTGGKSNSGAMINHLDVAWTFGVALGLLGFQLLL